MLLLIPLTSFALEAEAADEPVAPEPAEAEPAAMETLSEPAPEDSIQLETSATYAETLIEDFVERLYVLVLNRPSDPTGKAHWVRELSARRISGGQAAYGFFFSEEMALRNLSDSAFLDITRKVFEELSVPDYVD